MKTWKDVKKIKILILTPCNKIINVIFFSLILISKIITVPQLVTNIVKIIIYSLTLETKAQRNFFFFVEIVLIEKY